VFRRGILQHRRVSQCPGVRFARPAAPQDLSVTRADCATRRTCIAAAWRLEIDYKSLAWVARPLQ